MTAQQTFEMMRASGIIAIIRASSEDIGRRQAHRVVAAGLQVVEVSLSTPGALRVIESLVGGDAVIGAGTVLDRRSAEDVIAAGAEIIVCPIYDPEVVEVAVRHDVAVVPGCLTPTEMIDAMRNGATAVKIFPAHLWTPTALAGMLQALPHLPCVPTGGVDPGSAVAWISAGAVALGVGSALTAVDDPGSVVENLRASVAAARGGS